jgi:hypothetical protein
VFYFVTFGRGFLRVSFGLLGVGLLGVGFGHLRFGSRGLSFASVQCGLEFCLRPQLFSSILFLQQPALKAVSVLAVRVRDHGRHCDDAQKGNHHEESFHRKSHRAAVCTI